MNTYKLRTEDKGFKLIVSASYALETQKGDPWYQLGEDGKMRHYAVCPACDNPIQLINIEGHARNTEKPYGKHVPASIPRLAPYVQEAYDGCPLATKNHTRPQKSERKSGMNPLSVKIIETLRHEFDRVAVILQEATGIKVTVGLAEKMFENYLAERGYLYSRASLVNIPWIFAYMADAQSLVGRVIFDEELRQAILANVPEATFDKQKLVKKGKAFLSVNMCFLDHEITPKGNAIVESMTLSVAKDTSRHPQAFFTKKIHFNYERFQYLIGIPEGKGIRNQQMLDLAAKMLADL